MLYCNEAWVAESYLLTYEPPYLLVLRLNGVLVMDEARSMMREMQQMLDQAGCSMGILIDGRGVESVPLAVQEYVFGQAMHMAQLVAFAVITPPLSRTPMHEVMAQAAGMAHKVRTFNDEAPARDWLAGRM